MQKLYTKVIPEIRKFCRINYFEIGSHIDPPEPPSFNIKYNGYFTESATILDVYIDIMTNINNNYI